MRRAMLVFLCCISVSGATFHTGPLTCGMSSWIHFPVDRDVFSAYNKLCFDGYFSYGKLKGFIGLPLSYTLSKKDYKYVNGKSVIGDTIFGKFAPGDLNMYLGIRIGSVEPRIGIIVPLGYSTNTGVWLGSKNVILKTGAGFSGNLNKQLRLRYGGEFYFKYYVAGFPEIEGSKGKKGSWSVEPDLKVIMEPIKKWKVGIEALGGFKQLFPSWLEKKDFQGYELSYFVVPHIITSYDLSSRIYLTGKMGFGPSYKKVIDSPVKKNHWYHSGNAFNVGFSAGFYPRIGGNRKKSEKNIELEKNDRREY